VCLNRTFNDFQLNGLCDYEAAYREVSATFVVTVHWFRHIAMPLNLCCMNKEFGLDSAKEQVG
jgi:hypothetical protein